MSVVDNIILYDSVVLFNKKTSHCEDWPIYTAFCVIGYFFNILYKSSPANIWTQL